METLLQQAPVSPPPGSPADAGPSARCSRSLTPPGARPQQGSTISLANTPDCAWLLVIDEGAAASAARLCRRRDSPRRVLQAGHRPERSRRPLEALPHRRQGMVLLARHRQGRRVLGQWGSCCRAAGPGHRPPGGALVAASLVAFTLLAAVAGTCSATHRGGWCAAWAPSARPGLEPGISPSGARSPGDGSPKLAQQTSPSNSRTSWKPRRLAVLEGAAAWRAASTTPSSRPLPPPRGRRRPRPPGGDPGAAAETRRGGDSSTPCARSSGLIDGLRPRRFTAEAGRALREYVSIGRGARGSGRVQVRGEQRSPWPSSAPAHRPGRSPASAPR